MSDRNAVEYECGGDGVDKEGMKGVMHRMMGVMGWGMGIGRGEEGDASDGASIGGMRLREGRGCGSGDDSIGGSGDGSGGGGFGSGSSSGGGDGGGLQGECWDPADEPRGAQ